MYKFATAIGVDIGRTMLRTSLVRFNGEVIQDYSFRYSERPDRDKMISHIVAAIIKTRSEAASYNINPLCVGVSAKGFVDYENGVIIGPEQEISGWKNVELSKLVSRSVNLPVYVDNDANLMAIAEFHHGAAKGYNNIFFVALRSGIGGSIIIDRKLFRGTNNAAGELGQMSIDYSGPVSNKGVTGSLEDFASSVALVKSYLEISGQAEKENNNSLFRARDVFELSYKGDKHAVEAVAKNANYLGIGLANIISMFSPDIIVIGGGLAMARDEYIELIKKSAFSNSIEYCHKDVKIVRAGLGINSSLQGATLYALSRLDGKQI